MSPHQSTLVISKLSWHKFSPLASILGASILVKFLASLSSLLSSPVKVSKDNSWRGSGQAKHLLSWRPSAFQQNLFWQSVPLWGPEQLSPWIQAAQLLRPVYQLGSNKKTETTREFETEGLGYRDWLYKDGRAKRPARGQCGTQRPLRLEADIATGRGRGEFWSSGALFLESGTRVDQACPTTTGTRETEPLQRGRGSNSCFFLPLLTLHSPIHASHPPVLEKQVTGVRPFDSEQDRERARNRLEENSQENVHGSNPVKLSPLSYMWCLQDPAHIHPPAEGHCHLLEGLSHRHLFWLHWCQPVQ